MSMPLEGVTPPAGLGTLNITIPPPAPAAVDDGLPKTKTELDELINQRLEDARKQERDKLYPQMNDFQTRLEQIEQERQQLEAAKAEADRQAAESLEQARLQELSSTERITEVEQRLLGQLELTREQLALSETIRQQEHRLGQLHDYRTQRISENVDKIEPRLLEYVGGDTPEAIDASIAAVVEKTNQIFEEIAAAQGGQGLPLRPPPIRVSGTPPIDPSGSYEQQQRPMSAAEIAAMSPSEYEQMRPMLMQAQSEAVRQRGYGG